MVRGAHSDGVHLHLTKQESETHQDQGQDLVRVEELAREGTREDLVLRALSLL